MPRMRVLCVPYACLMRVLCVMRALCVLNACSIGHACVGSKLSIVRHARSMRFLCAPYAFIMALCATKVFFLSLSWGALYALCMRYLCVFPVSSIFDTCNMCSVCVFYAFFMRSFLLACFHESTIRALYACCMRALCALSV